MIMRDIGKSGGYNTDSIWNSEICLQRALCRESYHISCFSGKKILGE